MNKKQTIPDLIVKQSWWVIVFVSFCYLVYNHAAKKKENEMVSLLERKKELLEEKQILCNKKEDLQLRIESQSDPAWVEQVLMRELGVVPEGQMKVYFKKERSEK